jgi:hypothetical protein
MQERDGSTRDKGHDRIDIGGVLDDETAIAAGYVDVFDDGGESLAFVESCPHDWKRALELIALGLHPRWSTWTFVEADPEHAHDRALLAGLAAELLLLEDARAVAAAGNPERRGWHLRSILACIDLVARMGTHHHELVARAEEMLLEAVRAPLIAIPVDLAGQLRAFLRATQWDFPGTEPAIARALVDLTLRSASCGDAEVLIEALSYCEELVKPEELAAGFQALAALASWRPTDRTPPEDLDWMGKCVAWVVARADERTAEALVPLLFALHERRFAAFLKEVRARSADGARLASELLGVDGGRLGSACLRIRETLGDMDDEVADGVVRLYDALIVSFGPGVWLCPRFEDVDAAPDMAKFPALDLDCLDGTRILDPTVAFAELDQCTREKVTENDRLLHYALTVQHLHARLAAGRRFEALCGAAAFAGLCRTRGAMLVLLSGCAGEATVDDSRFLNDGLVELLGSRGGRGSGDWLLMGAGLHHLGLLVDAKLSCEPGQTSLAAQVLALCGSAAWAEDVDPDSRARELDELLTRRNWPSGSVGDLPARTTATDECANSDTTPASVESVVTLLLALGVLGQSRAFGHARDLCRRWLEANGDLDDDDTAFVRRMLERVERP